MKGLSASAYEPPEVVAVSADWQRLLATSSDEKGQFLIAGQRAGDSFVHIDPYTRQALPESSDI